MESSGQPGIKIRFGKAVRRRRRELDISQEELAERSGLHRTYISSVERGERSPTLDSIYQISKALDIKIVELFTLYGIEEQS